MKQDRYIRIVNYSLILAILIAGYQNCASFLKSGTAKPDGELRSESWELSLVSESGEMIAENSSTYLTVNSNVSLDDYTCEWSHERNDMTTHFENKECGLKLDAVTVDDNGLYSVRVVSKDGDAVFLGPIVLNISPGDGEFPELTNVLKSYSLELGEEASLLATPNSDQIKRNDCAIEWMQLETGKKVGCGTMLTFKKVDPSTYGDYSVTYAVGDKKHIHYFSVEDQKDREPAAKALSCGHATESVANLISELRSTVPEMYVGEFGDSRWTYPNFSRETADRLCVLSDPNFISADTIKMEKVDFHKAGLPLVSVRRFDPMARKWASVCQYDKAKSNEKTCGTEWIVKSLTCCKAQ